MKQVARRNRKPASDARAAARKEFIAKAMPYMMAMFNKAEAYGIDWRKIPMSQLSSQIILAEEFSSPEPMEAWRE